ncbi:MAG: hypothetical protein ACOC7J_00150, partial [Armatimonadota bacterium]
MPMDDTGPVPADDAEEAADDTATDGAQVLADVIKKWPESFIMTQRITEKETDRTITFTAAMKMGEQKPLKMKTEIENGGMVIDYEEKVQYMWDTSTSTAFKRDLSEMEAQQENPYAHVDPDTKITGSETIDGVECWIVET